MPPPGAQSDVTADEIRAGDRVLIGDDWLHVISIGDGASVGTLIFEGDRPDIKVEWSQRFTISRP